MVLVFFLIAKSVRVSSFIIFVPIIRGFKVCWTENIIILAVLYTSKPGSLGRVTDLSRVVSTFFSIRAAQVITVVSTYLKEVPESNSWKSPGCRRGLGVEKIWHICHRTHYSPGRLLACAVLAGIPCNRAFSEGLVGGISCSKWDKDLWKLPSIEAYWCWSAIRVRKRTRFYIWLFSFLSHEILIPDSCDCPLSPDSVSRDTVLGLGCTVTSLDSIKEPLK